MAEGDVDARIEKEFAPGGPVGFTFGIDVFNVTNENTGLYYQVNTGVGSAGQLTPKMSLNSRICGVNRKMVMNSPM